MFTLLVPATQVRQYLGQHKGEDEEVARRMAEAAQRRFKESGIPLDYQIGPPDPVQAVDEEWAKRQYDQVIVSTYTARRSRYLAMKGPDKIEARHKVPVVVVEAQPDFVNIHPLIRAGWLRVPSVTSGRDACLRRVGSQL